MIPIVEYEHRAEKLGAVLGRSASFSPEVDAAVREILAAVRERGEEAVLELTERFDGVRPERLKVPAERLAAITSRSSGSMAS